MKHQPPSLFTRFLRWYCHEKYLDEIEGDFNEAFHENAAKMGLFPAKLRYALSVISSFRPLNWDLTKTQNSNVMTQTSSNIKLAFRNLKKSSGFSALNIVGLAMGLACALLIMTHVTQELSYDSFHSKKDRIYRLVRERLISGNLESSVGQPVPIKDFLLADIPDIEKIVRFYKTFGKVPLLGHEDKKFYEERLFFTDPEVFQLFDFEMISGNPATALSRPNTVVLTESMAAKYFGNEEALGKRLVYENGYDLIVTGVLKDLPANSHFKFDFLASFQDVEGVLAAAGTNTGWRDSWYWNPSWYYLLLAEGAEVASVEKQFKQFIDKHIEGGLKEVYQQMFLQRLTEIHLDSNYNSEIETNSSKASVYIFAIIGIFILAIAGINYTNMSISNALKRRIETGIRKSIGATTVQLMYLFVLESLIHTVVAIALALGILKLTIPWINQSLNLQLSVDLTSPMILVSLVLFTMLMSLFSGIYPAMSSIARQSLSRTGVVATSHRKFTLKKALVLFQFSISGALIIGTLIVNAQFNFLLNRHLGFDKEALVYVSIRGTEAKQKNPSFKTSLLSSSHVLNVSFLSNIVGEEIDNRPFVGEGTEEGYSIPGLYADLDLIETFNMKFVAGRNFDGSQNDRRYGYIINEKALETYGWQSAEEAVGKKFENSRRLGDTPGYVVGVLEDFNFSPLHAPIEPLVILDRPWWYSYAAVKIRTENIGDALKHMENVWHDFEPDRPMSFFFLDQRINDQYHSEKQLSSLFSFFTGLAMIIASIGLISVVSYSLQQRLKEMSIRKVLGAGPAHIFRKMSESYLQIALAAALLSSPIIYLVAKSWLQDYTYRIEISFGLFVISAAILTGLCLLLVSTFALKAILVNPAQILRNE